MQTLRRHCVRECACINGVPGCFIWRPRPEPTV